MLQTYSIRYNLTVNEARNQISIGKHGKSCTFAAA